MLRCLAKKGLKKKTSDLVSLQTSTDGLNVDDCIITVDLPHGETEVNLSIWDPAGILLSDLIRMLVGRQVTYILMPCFLL